MKKAAEFLVDHRRLFLCVFLVLAAVSVLLIPQVRINYDLTKYLPEDSRMKQGMQVMEQEFGPVESSRLRVMFTGLSEAEKKEVHTWLSGLDQVAEAAWNPGEDYNRDGYTLYELTTEYGSHSAEAAALFSAIHEKYDGRGLAATGGDIHEANVPLLSLHMVFIAVGLVLLILVIMCNSWFEPVVFLVNIGIAVAINLGTNIVFSSISEYTNSIVGIMQLVLSMDYSIILMDRFTQEREKGSGSLPAMKAAIAAAFPAVTGSSLTTFAGLLCMVFMRFRLGADMGVALAKSVIVSLICIFTVLPSLILISEKWIIKTRKKALHIPSKGYAHFAVRFRIAFPVFFLILFVGVFFAKNNTEIQYTMLTDSSVNDVFGEQNTIVMLYETRDSDRIGDLLAPLEEDEKVTGVTAYCNTLGKAYRADEIAALFGDAAAIDPSMIRMIYQMYGAGHGGTGEDTALTPAELIAFLQDSVLQNPLFSAFIDDSTREQIAEAGSMMEEYASKLEGDHYGRVILTTKYPEDSAEIRRFIEAFSERCRETLEGETWLIGTSVMNEEMSQTFNAELNRITLLSAAAIFLVIAITFRSLILPLILVLTVQCGIYLTMAFIGLSGNGMFYLAILMVQCILMGATIDYGILFSSYYRDHRRHEDCPAAIQHSYEGALHTILTSALIMIAGAGILGFVFANPAIGEVCLTISRGAISATLLIIFILPGILAAFDRIVRRGSGSGDKSSE